MKKTLLLCGLFISLMFWGGFSFAQCTPDPLVTDPEGNGEMRPDTLNAGENAPMNITLTIICPDTASAGSLGHLTVNKIRIHSISGKPTWLSYACDNGNCDYVAGVRQCALVTGTPPVGSAGTIALHVLVDVYTTILGSPVCVTCTPYPNGYDSGMPLVLVVHPEGWGVAEYNNTGFEVIQNQPNPFSDETRIGCTTKTAETVSLKVVDMLGNTVYTEKMNTRAGENYFNFTGSNLSNGVYFYSIMSNQNKIVTLKMVKGK